MTIAAFKLAEHLFRFKPLLFAPRFVIIAALRRTPLLLVLTFSMVPLAAAAAPKASLSDWTKVKHSKAPPAVKAPPPRHAPTHGRDSRRDREPAKPARSEGAAVNGKVAVLGFTGEGAARVQQAVVSTLRTRGLEVTTSLRPVDSAEQYREMAATLQLAAYIDGTVGGAGTRGQATVRVRSGVTGRRIASLRVTGDRTTLASDVGNKLWPRTGPQLTRLCAAASKPRKAGRHALRIDAGTPLENTADDTSDIPAHLRNDPPKDDAAKEDPWADEGT